MKYQKRYKPKTKFEKFLKVYFIIGILVIVLTGVYASVKSMQRKKEVASETIIHRGGMCSSSEVYYSLVKKPRSTSVARRCITPVYVLSEKRYSN